jgi:hypothetical protein
VSGVLVWLGRGLIALALRSIIQRQRARLNPVVRVAALAAVALL